MVTTFTHAKGVTVPACPQAGIWAAIAAQGKTATAMAWVHAVRAGLAVRAAQSNNPAHALPAFAAQLGQCYQLGRHTQATLTALVACLHTGQVTPALTARRLQLLCLGLGNKHGKLASYIA